MSVRRAKTADARAVAEVHVASWRAAYRGLLPEAVLENLSVEGRKRQWRRILGDPTQVTWVYEQDGLVVAFANIGPCRDEDKSPADAELMSLYALEGVWGRRVGFALWQAVQAHLLASGYPEVSLWVLSSNERARHFYERIGFKADGKTKTEVWREGVVLHETRYARAVGKWGLGYGVK